MQITNLEQAGRHLMDSGVVDFSTMTVEGKQLLEVCGFSTARPRAVIAEQIAKHGFVEGKDFMRTDDRTHEKAGQKPVIYHFTMNAANHVLLAAMTEKGKLARQDAIDTKVEQQYQIPQTYAAALLEAGRLALELEQKEAQLSIAAPKAAIVDRVMDRTNLLNATQVGQQVGLSAVKLNRNIDQIGGVYSKSVKRGRVFTQPWLDSGFGEMKQTEQGYPQALFTTKGAIRVVELLTSEGVV